MFSFNIKKGIANHINTVIMALLHEGPVYVETVSQSTCRSSDCMYSVLHLISPLSELSGRNPLLDGSDPEHIGEDCMIFSRELSKYPCVFLCDNKIKHNMLFLKTGWRVAEDFVEDGYRRTNGLWKNLLYTTRTGSRSGTDRPISQVGMTSLEIGYLKSHLVHDPAYPDHRYLNLQGFTTKDGTRDWSNAGGYGTPISREIVWFSDDKQPDKTEEYLDRLFKLHFDPL